MKRFRVSTIDFDTRANMLAIVIEEHWEEHIKELHRRNQRLIVEGLRTEFGEDRFEHKLANFIELGAKPLSIVAFHNKFSEQVRRAFIVGAYYPSLLGACGLGERILNHLVLTLRDDFRDTPGYKRVASKDSFANWRIPIDVLLAWGVLRKEVVSLFEELNAVRNRAVHFDPPTERNDRSLALKAVHCLNRIIESQFGSFGALPWFIPETRGAAYIARSAESDPFIRRVYVPNSDYVGPWHTPVLVRGGKVHITDDYLYEDRVISDEEFRDLLGVQPPGR